MTVKELKVILESIDDNRVVILQKDGEGNGYSPCAGGDDNAVYEPDSTWSGEVKYEKLTKEIRAAGHDKNSIGHGQPAFVLWPTN